MMKGSERGSNEPEKVAPGDIEFQFGLSFPNSQSMRKAPIIAVLPDDKLYVADTDLDIHRSAVFVTRTSRNGETDMNFGRNGFVSEDIEISAGVMAGLLPREDGGVVAMVKSSSNDLLDIALVCFKADGSLDPTFGEGGKIIHRIPKPAESDSQVELAEGALDTSQRSQAAHGAGKGIVAAVNGAFYCLIGARLRWPYYALIRCRSDGQLDLDFNGTGYVSDGQSFYREWAAADMVVGTNGCVTLVGSFRNVGALPERLAFWRFNPDGSLDRSFGEEGYAFFDADSTEVDAADLFRMELDHVELLPGGGITACGQLVTRSEANIFQYFGLVACLDSSGKLLDTFNSGKFRLFGVIGSQTTDFIFGGLGVQADGKIVAGGGVGDSPVTERELLVARFRPEGNIDSTFGKGGVVRFSPKDSRVTYMSNLLIDAGGKILGAGAGGSDNNTSSMRPFVFQMSS